MLPKVAIIGRPNVGKSTLFNRLTGKRLALVHDEPGVTRDRREAEGRISDLKFTIVDTAGLDDQIETELSAAMWKQTERALADCQIILFVIDARAGVTPIDEYYADFIRRQNKSVILLANKCEGGEFIATLGEASRLGLGAAIPFSSAHGEGLSDLYDALEPQLFYDDDKDQDQKPSEKPLQLAIVGRPNVGKSTLINKLLNEERLITADEPGVTRDSIAVDWLYNGRPIKLIDTAGMRKKANITESLEKLAIRDGLRAVDYAHVVILVLDHEEPLAKQEATIANKVIEEGRVLLIAVNKWDLVKNKQSYLEEVYYQLGHTLPQIKGIPCVPISALKGKNLDKLLEQAFTLYDHWNVRISTGRLNRWLEEVVAYHPPPIVGRARLKIKFMTQIKTRPPSFVVFTNKANDVPDTYLRYLQNSLRETFNLPGVPIRINAKSSENPYDKKK